MANEIANATPRGKKSKYRETSGSPMAPRAIPTTVMPTCTVEMNRTGSSIILSAVRAARFPPSARSSRRDRRAVMSEYSAATKIAFRSTRKSTTRMRATSLIASS